MATERRAPDVTVYCLGWRGDRAIEEGEIAEAILHSRIYIDGEEAPYLSGITVEAQGGDFVAVNLRANVGSIRFVPVSSEDWAQEDLAAAESARLAAAGV